MRPAGSRRSTRSWPATSSPRSPAPAARTPSAPAPAGLSYLAYGDRVAADTIWYPRSRKIAFPGLKVIGRLEPLGYWDGEE